MVDISKIFEKRITEDAILDDDAGAPVGDVVAPGDAPAAGAADIVQADAAGIGTNDILGKCDHSKNGFMAAGCFHIPGKALKKYSREIPGGKNKYKNPYAKGLSVITEADLDNDTVLKISKLDMEDVADFVEDNYDLQPVGVVQSVEAVAYWPKDKLYFIKAKLADGSTSFVLADFDGQKFIMPSTNRKKTFTKDEAIDMYIKDGKIADIYMVYGSTELDETASQKED